MSQGNNTAEWWAGEAGNAYHRRNRVGWRSRIPFWKQILDITGARSVYEFGCGPGWNLSSIKAGAEWDVEVSGQEINDSAGNQGSICGLDIWETDKSFETWNFELTCTVGALIHVPPEDIEGRMKWMIERSCDYVLSVEYESPEEIMIPYRGENDKLWSRPYGKLYQDLGLKMVLQADAGEGFDNCTASLLRLP